jgi:hypothetical protein
MTCRSKTRKPVHRSRDGGAPQPLKRRLAVSTILETDGDTGDISPVIACFVISG